MNLYLEAWMKKYRMEEKHEFISGSKDEKRAEWRKSMDL